MAVSVDTARDFVYRNGALWERALFSYLFEGGTAERVQQCLRPYKNPDGGWGHGMEQDIACPASQPVALEYLLTVNRDVGLPLGDLVDDAAAWVEADMREDGLLRVPPEFYTYPLAPWWNQPDYAHAPDSITGNLIRLGRCTPSLAEKTARWAKAHVTLDAIAAAEWLFMCYHAHDYYMNLRDAPDLARYQRAVMDRIVTLAEAAPEGQYYVLFQFAPTPEDAAAKGIPQALLDRNLDYLAGAQREDGAWADEHGLPRWYPYVTIVVLHALRSYGRLAV